MKKRGISCQLLFSLCSSQPVKKGDHLTISYMNPREQSFSRRRKYFLSQHYFDVSSEIRDLPVIQKFDATNRSAEEVEVRMGEK